MSLNNQTELAIIEAARKIFISKGYSGTTMEKIATEANVSKASLHYYYRSKDKLFEIVLSEVREIIQEKLILIIKSEDNIEVIIKKINDVYVETLINHPYLPNFIINEISSNPEKIVKILLGDKLSTFTILRMMVIIRNKTFKGNKDVVNSYDLILNVISLNVFPFLIRPIIKNIFKIEDEQFNSYMNNRKSGLSTFLFKALKQ